MKKLQGITYNEWRLLKASLIVAVGVSVLAWLAVMAAVHFRTELSLSQFAADNLNQAAFCVLTLMWVILMFESIGSDREQAAFLNGIPVSPAMVFGTRLIFRGVITGAACIACWNVFCPELNIHFWFGTLSCLAGILMVVSVCGKPRWLTFFLALLLTFCQLPGVSFFICFSGFYGWTLNCIQYMVLVVIFSGMVWRYRNHGRRIAPLVRWWVLIMIVLPWLEYSAARSFWAVRFSQAVARADRAGIRVFSEKSLDVFEYRSASRSFFGKILEEFAGLLELSFQEKLQKLEEKYGLTPGDVAIRMWGTGSLKILIPGNSDMTDEAYIDQMTKAMMLCDIDSIRRQLEHNLHKYPHRARLFVKFLKKYRNIQPPNKYNLSAKILARPYEILDNEEAILSMNRVYSLLSRPLYNKTKTLTLNALIDKKGKPYDLYFLSFSVTLELYITAFELQARRYESGGSEFPDELPADLARPGLIYTKGLYNIILSEGHHSIRVNNPETKK